MKYNEISPLMRAFAGTFMTLRSVGFEAENIYLEVARSARFEGVLSAFCLVRQAEKEFHIELGSLGELTEDELRAEYMRISSTESLSEEDKERIVNECEARQKLSELLIVMHLKGFDIPSSLGEP